MYYKQYEVDRRVNNGTATEHTTERDDIIITLPQMIGCIYLAGARPFEHNFGRGDPSPLT